MKLGCIIMKTCICDKCKKEIKINIREMVIGHDDDMEEITEQFFVCPECNAHYTIFISDKFMRSNIRTMQKLAKKSYNQDGRDALVKEMQEHLNKLKIQYNRI